MRNRAIGSLLLSFGLIHCSGGDDDEVVTFRDGGTVEVRDAGFYDAGPPRDAGPPHDAGPPRDAGFVTDDNDSIATATPAMLNDSRPIRQRIDPAGDRDFYSFEAEQGQFLLMWTTTGDVNGTTTNPVLRLYNSAEELVAENNTGHLYGDFDAEIIYHVPVAGTYYVEVLEWSDWSTQSNEPLGGRDYLYTLTLRTLSDRNVGTNFDLEGGDDPASALPLEFNDNDFAYFVGTFDGLDDVDWLVTESRAYRRIDIARAPVGLQGYGSTTTGGDLVMQTTDTSSVVAKVALQDIQALNTPFLPGTYHIGIGHAGLQVGSNDFYVVKVVLRTENPPAPAEPNDSPANAGQLMLTGSPTRSQFLLTDIEDGDMDVFAFEVMAGEQPSAACGAQGSGSGVRGLTVEILDSNEVVLGTATEAPPNTAFVEQMPTTPGTHYVRVSKTGQAMDVDGAWVRCGIRSGPPN